MDANTAQGFYGEHFESVIYFALFALVLNFIAKNKGFFSLPPPSARDAKEKGLPFLFVLICFGFYLFFNMAFAPFVAYCIKQYYLHFRPGETPAIEIMGWVQFLTVASVLSSFIWYSCKTKNRVFVTRLVKDYSIPSPSNPLYDWFLGVLTWFLSFPIVVVVGQLADILVYFLFGLETYEQVAVRYLKMTLGSPSMLTIALFTILLAAPMIEEFLFRALLQSWFKKFLGTKAAILLAAFCFALFHVAPSQGMGNISLVISLFSFACFLGFIYEKQGSLFASIGLHMTFNAVSTFRILFMPEG